MYSATFIFDTRQFDSEFHRLDALIAAAARQTEGYLGEEAWEDVGTMRHPLLVVQQAADA